MRGKPTYQDPAAKHSLITEDRARRMSMARASGVSAEVLADAYNPTPSAVRKAVERYRRETA